MSRLTSLFPSLLALAFAYACEPLQPAEAPPQPTPALRLRLLLPLAQHAAVECDKDCATRHAPGTTPFYECFAACPGADASDEASCGAEDVRPKAACYMVDVIDDPAAPPEASTSAAPNMIGTLLQTALSASTRSASGSKPTRPKIRPALANPADRANAAPAPSPRAAATPVVKAQVAEPAPADARFRSVPRDGGAQ